MCQLADLCVSESQPTPEEAQLWAAFGGVAADPAPDATAARLRLSMAAAGTPAEALLPWSIHAEVAAYVTAWRHISAACRLTADEEQELLESLPQDVIKAPMLANRACYLYLRGRVAEDEAVGHPTLEQLGVKSSAGKVGGGSASACPLVYPDAPQQSAFDSVEDRSCLEEGVMGEGPLGRLAGLAHNFVQYEEKDVTGTAGLQKVGEWLDSGRGLHSSTVHLNLSRF